MEDLAKRLRAEGGALCEEAAEELEDLARQLRGAEHDVHNLERDNEALAAERDDLQAGKAHACSACSFGTGTLAQPDAFCVKGGGGLTYETVNGRKMAFFQDWEVLTSDAILNTEAAVA